MSRFKVHRLRSLHAEFNVPGDKSISHRSIIFGALAEGITRIGNFLPSEDCLATIRAFQALGVEIELVDEHSVYIEGCGGELNPCGEAIDCGNSGTTMRLLSGVLASRPFTSRLIGDESLHRRPMKRVATPLNQMGTTLTCEGSDGRPPLKIEGTFPLKATNYTSPVASAQIKSAFLIAALRAKGVSHFSEPAPSRDHTERMLRRFGASLRKEGNEFELLGQQRMHGCDLVVPGDFSSAAFWMVAGATARDGQVILNRVGLNPTRTGLLSVLSRMGAQIQETVEKTQWEPEGKIVINSGPRLQGTTIEGKEIANVIDEIPILAVAAALADGETHIRDAEELRVKESDRLATVTEMLRAFGVEVEEFDDGITIQGGKRLKPARIRSHGDHRIAMAGAILGLSAGGTSVIEDTDCVATSYPNFSAHLKHVLANNPTDRSHVTAGIGSFIGAQSGKIKGLTLKAIDKVREAKANAMASEKKDQAPARDESKKDETLI